MINNLFRFSFLFTGLYFLRDANVFTAAPAPREKSSKWGEMAALLRLIGRSRSYNVKRRARDEWREYSKNLFMT